MDLNNILFIDIETVSHNSSLNELDSRWRKLFEHKMRYYLEKEQDKDLAQIYEEKAAIYAEFGRIICIGLGFFNKGQLRIKTISGHDEEELITGLFELISQHFSNPERHALCGHNIREFDIPYICRRALIHGLQLPALLQIAGKKPWELKYLYDTLDLWKFGDIKHYISLDLLSACLGLESPKEDMDGSQVGQMYYVQNDLDRIARYCAQDVWVTANVWLRLHLMPAISFDEVYYSNNS